MKYGTMYSRGRITIPAEIRKRFGITPGMRVAFFDEGDKIRVVPIDKNYFRRFAGILETDGKALRSLIQERKRDREREERKLKRFTGKP
ncbi:MAG: AbrB/MazE/SpoVT family DNA-binding domain-containing protein [Ignavibacteriae bacterium]|nr:AbrB/MazE/SpoVT family DNA-binding domain-containing protein [Ignavibacteriota bacterium]